MAPPGFTILETLIGLFIFLGIALPIIRHAGFSSAEAEIKDRRIAYALLRGECAVMYRNQELPAPKRFLTVGKSVYEISCTAEKDSILMSWSMVVGRAGKSIASVHGLLYVPRMPYRKMP
jgi:hypothetical protein